MILKVEFEKYEVNDKTADNYDLLSNKTCLFNFEHLFTS